MLGYSVRVTSSMMKTGLRLASSLKTRWCNASIEGAVEMPEVRKKKESAKVMLA